MTDRLLRSAHDVQRSGNLAEAERLYGEVLRANPSNFEAQCMLGFVQFRLGRTEAAHRTADEALKKASGSSRDLYNLGYLLQMLSRHEDALRCFDRALAARADYFEALVHRGLSLAELKRHGDAAASFERAVALRPEEAGAWYNRGNALLGLQRFDDAVASYDRALSLRPDYGEAWENRGHALRGAGRGAEALASFEEAARFKPGEARLKLARGIALVALKRYGDALASLDDVLALEPENFEALFQRANALLFLSRPAEALAPLDRCLAARPDHIDAAVSRGAALAGLSRYEDALTVNDRVLTLKPDCVEALVNRALVLNALRKHEAALASADAALALVPGLASALFQRGNALAALRRYEDSVAAHEQCLEAQPDHVDALVGRSFALLGLGRIEDAVRSCDAALEIKPDGLEALSNRGGLLMLLKRFEAASADYEALLALNPEYRYAAGNLLQCRLHCCDWRDLDRQRAAIAESVRERKRVVTAFQHVTSCRSAAEQLECTRLWVAHEIPPAEPVWRGERYGHERIRVAYVSEDFRTHAVASLMAGVWESHDRARFETFAISFGFDDQSEMRSRIQRSFEHFIDVRFWSDTDVATWLHRHEIDIVVDLMGYSGHCRPGILALRPAPVQVNYLGYPATMGADFMDYIVADRILIGEAEEAHYQEKVVRLPGSYMANDSRRRIAERGPSRKEAGLPDAGFVFCCFNSPGKFGPETFGIWMRLLDAVKGSVLWLPDPGPAAMRNLKREAQKRGVAAERLVFAPFLPRPEDHLARLPLADLFLDTEPYNAHTTASDALWAGVPVLTMPGNTLASRVAASLLTAIGLPELIAGTPQVYETTALRLAREPMRLAEVRATLERNRKTHALFDTARFTRRLEAAYLRMWERSERGLMPESFAVEAEQQGALP